MTFLLHDLGFLDSGSDCGAMQTAVLRSARKTSGAGRAWAGERRGTHEVGRWRLELACPVLFPGTEVRGSVVKEWAAAFHSPRLHLPP